MKVNPVVTATISRAPTSVYDHVLTILPTANGTTTFESVSDFKTLTHLFGNNFKLPGKTEEENEDYSTVLLNSLKYILDSGVPLLCTSVKTSVNAAIRIYYLEEEAQPWYVCSISHKSLPDGLETLPTKLKNFFNSGIIKGTNVKHTLCHSLPLNRVKNDQDEWVQAESNGHARFITLPIMDIENPDVPYVPYLLMLEDNSLEDEARNDELYPSTSPIQERDIYGNLQSVVMTCHGDDLDIMDEVTRINRILNSLNSSREDSFTKWKCVFDQANNRLLFISNQYIYPSAMYSVYGEGDFVPDTNISGNLLDEYTRPYAVLDVESKLSGEVGNEFRVEFKKTIKGNFIRIYQLANCLELLQLYESEGTWEYNHDSEYLNIKQYNDTIDAMDIFSNSYFSDKRIELFGGYDDETYSYADIADRIGDWIGDQDECPIDFIYDCMCEHLSFHERILQYYSSFENQNIHIITAGTLDSNTGGYNPYTDEHKFIFYDTRLVDLVNYGDVSLGAVIAVNLHRYNFMPSVQVIMHDDYANRINLPQGDYVITPEVDHNVVYLNELKIAGLDLESSIDRYLSSFIYNEFQQLFEDNLIGEILLNDDEYMDLCQRVLEYMSIAPSIIKSYSISDLNRTEGTLTLSLLVNREELSGGTRNLYININL